MTEEEKSAQLLNDLKKQRFKDISVEMIKFLNEHYNPHATVIITPTGAELV